MSVEIYNMKHENVIRGTMLQAGRSKVLLPIKSLDFSIDIILPAMTPGRFSLRQK
jgi:hypothetical protein